MAKLPSEKLKFIDNITNNSALKALEKINKLAIPHSMLNDMSKTTNTILKVGLQQRAVFDKLAKISPNIYSLGNMSKIGQLMEENRLRTLSTFDGITKTAFNIPSLGNMSKIGQLMEENRLRTLSAFDGIAKTALINNKFTMPDLFPVSKVMLSIHKNLANSLGDKSWRGLFQNLENLTADINLSDVKIESQGDTLVINDEVITEESIHDFTEALSDFISTGKKKSIELLGKGLKYLLRLYRDYCVLWLLFCFLPEDSMLRLENWQKLIYGKPTKIQQGQIKQIKSKQKTKIKTIYIANRRIMPVYLYANRTSPITSYLFCGDEVKIRKSIKRKHWLFVEWICDGEKETGWVLGRYILKTSSKKRQR